MRMLSLDTASSPPRVDTIASPNTTEESMFQAEDDLPHKLWHRACWPCAFIPQAWRTLPRACHCVDSVRESVRRVNGVQTAKPLVFDPPGLRGLQFLASYVSTDKAAVITIPVFP